MSAELLEMLTYKRPAGSATEMEFIDRFVAPIADHKDGYGNYMAQVGDDPRILWSAHTDTVHHQAGRQRVHLEGKMVVLSKKKRGTCLGADNAGGVWLLREMIGAGVPGLYVFHREEECGGNGSQYIAKKTPALLEGIDMAVAFDRRGYDSVITHQGGRTASDKFAAELAEVLGGKFAPDDTGVFTDTANYAELVAECTNVSIGYHAGHGPMESLDLPFITALRDTLVKADFSSMKTHRDPSAREDHFASFFAKLGSWSQPTNDMERFVKDNPEGVAAFLEDNGFTQSDIEDYCWR